MGPCQARARTSAFLDPQAGYSPPDKGRCGRVGSKCLFTGFPKEAVLPSPSTCLQGKPDGWFFGFLSLSLSLCLSLSWSPSVSLSLSMMRQIEGRYHGPSIFLH